MKEEILDLIQINNHQNFIFSKCPQNIAVGELKKNTQKVSDVDGIYFVFSELKANRQVQEHLVYEINNNAYEFIYFGIAGGLTANGKEGNQKLNGRINNVVGSKSIRRAIKWNITLEENDLTSFTVFYCYLKQPKSFEDKIYKYLKNQKLKYPLLNVKRGKPLKK
jgi:hypothetical protein